MNINKKELIKAVNDYDKSFGIDLKRPEVFSNPSVYKEILLLRVDAFITEIICRINGIDSGEFLKETDIEENDFYNGKLFKSEDVMTPRFTDLSNLNWGSDDKYNQSSDLFRYRFLTIVLYKFLGNIGKITMNIIKNNPDEIQHHSIDEQSIMIIKNIFENILVFSKIIICGDVPHKIIILKINEYLSYTKNMKEVTVRQYNEKVNKIALEIRSLISSDGLFNPSPEIDDLLIYNILKLCTLLSIKTVSDDYVPDFEYIKNATRYHDLINLIQEIGENVLRETNGKYPPLLYAFINASPKVKSEYNIESHEYESIRIGLLLLDFVEFILDDNKTFNFIKEMKRKGI